MVPTAHSRGIALIWVAILLLVFAAFVGIAIDTFYAVLTAQQLQAGADGAALAGARLVRRDPDDARDAVLAIAGENRAGGKDISLDRNDDNADDGDVVIGRYSRLDQTFTVTLDDPNAVKVRAKRAEGTDAGPLAFLFGPIFGVNTAEVDRYAIGMVGGDLKLGIIALNENEEGAFHIQGNVTVTVNDGGIQVNSSHGDAATHNGSSADVNALEIFVAGGTDENWEQVNFVGETYTDSTPVSDPFAALPEPNYTVSGGAPVVVTGGVRVGRGPIVPVTPTSLAPGYYSGISLLGGNTTMQPGLYVINGPFIVSGTANLTAEGVMIYLADLGSLSLIGSGNVVITPMTTLDYGSSGPTIPSSLADERIAIFQSRGNDNDATINGTSGVSIEGRLYFPDNHVLINGNGGAIGNGLVADTMEFSGIGTVTLDNDIVIQKDRFVFLVE